MGCYINPHDTSKEAWLEAHATKLLGPPNWDEVPKGSFVVCWVQNPAFSAAGIAFDERELQAFKYPDDRPKQWYVAPIDELRKVSPLDYWVELSKRSQR